VLKQYLKNSCILPKIKESFNPTPQTRNLDSSLYPALDIRKSLQDLLKNSRYATLEPLRPEERFV